MNTVLAREQTRKLLGNAESELGSDLVAKLSAPLVVAAPDEWAESKSKLMVYGQETFGWGFRADESASGQEVWTLTECLKVPDAVDALANAYKRFDFAETQPGNRRGSFWSAHRHFADRLEGGDYRKILWTNIARCDTSPLNNEKAGVWEHLGYEEIDRVCAWEKQLIHAELEEAGARAVIFFTGPNYDYMIERVFEDVAFHAVAKSGEETNVLSHVVGEGLPVATYRTYHPAYLSWSGRGHVLDVMTVVRGAARP